MTKNFSIIEIAFILSFVLLSIWFVGQYGFIGMSYSFAVNYGLYFIVMIYAV